MNTSNQSPSRSLPIAAMGALFPDNMAAMDATSLRSLLADYERCSALSNESVSALQARMPSLASPMGGAPYELRPGGVALIRCEGVLLQRPGIIARIFLGAVGSDELANAVEAAAADSSVRSILLQVSSPGGSVLGTPELAAAVEEAAQVKPVVTVTDGMLASAAYWFTSGSSAIYATGPSVMVGSIGAVMVHTYTPAADGTVVTEIKSGRFKTVGTSSKPLQGEDLAHLQERTDYMATLIINSAAKNRGLSPSVVAAQEARIYIGQQAIDARLVDGFMGFRALESQMASDPGKFHKRQRSGGRPGVGATAAPVAGAAESVQRFIAGVTPARAAAPEGQSEQDVRAEAAGDWIKALADGRWSSLKPPRVMTHAEWFRAGEVRGTADKVSTIEGMKREGYIHPYINASDTRAFGTPGAPSRLSRQLPPAEQAARARVWSQLKACSILDALKQLGFAR